MCFFLFLLSFSFFSCLLFPDQTDCWDSLGIVNNTNVGDGRQSYSLNGDLIMYGKLDILDRYLAISGMYIL